MAFLPHPVDRVHSYVAWILLRQVSRSTTAPWSATTAGYDGWSCCSRHILSSGTGCLLPAGPPAPPSAWSPWNPQALANAFNTVSLTPPPSTSDWVVDSGASSHIASNSGMVTLSLSSSFPSSIVVGNGATLPVVGTGYSTLPSPFHLNNVLVAPDIIKNLLSV